MTYFIVFRIVVAIIGSFGTAYLHQRTGRDVQMGGLIGLAVGGVLGMYFLLMLWVWVYYFSGSYPVGRIYNSRRMWFRWWE
jgi:hypothetical protein